MFMILSLLCVLTNKAQGQAQGQQTPIESFPTDTTAFKGDTVHFPCILREPGFCNVYWYRMDMQMYFARNDQLMARIPSEVRERYSVVGDTSVGDFSLQIVNASTWDDGEYQCACYTRSFRDSFVTDEAHLHIKIPPTLEYPKCEMHKKYELLLPGDEVELRCISSGGDPPVQLQWNDGDLGLTSEMSWNQENEETTAKVRTVVSPENDLSRFYCTASGEALVTSRNCSVGPIAVAAPPPIHIASSAPTAGPAISQDTNELSFTCRPNENFTRDVNNFTWYVNNDHVQPGKQGFVLENNGRTLRVTDLSLLNMDLEILCQLSNNGWVVSNSSTIVSVTDNERVEATTSLPPEYPKCEMHKKYGLLLPGDEVELLCISNGGHDSPVQLQWFNGELGVTSETIWNTVKEETITKHRTIVSPENNLSKFYCKASGEVAGSAQNCSVGPVVVAAPPPIHIASNIQKVWEDVESHALVGGETISQDMIELSFTCGPSGNFTRDINNFTWFVNNDPVRPGKQGFVLENNGRTLRVTDLSLLYNFLDIEIVCQLSNNGWAVANSSTIVSLNDNDLITTDTAPKTEGSGPEKPDIFIHKHPKKWRLWPIWLLIICVLMTLFLLILLAIYAPVICGCNKKGKKPPHNQCNHTVPTTKSATQVSDFHYTHGQGCETAENSRNTLNFYEMPESEQQRQQVEATLHVIVHSGNNATCHTVNDQPIISTTESVVTSDYGTVGTDDHVPPTNNHVGLPPTNTQAVGNYYHPDMDHYQKVRPGARPAYFATQGVVPPSPKPQPPARKDSLEPHYQYPRSHSCCMNQTWGHNTRNKPVCQSYPLPNVITARRDGGVLRQDTTPPP